MPTTDHRERIGELTALLRLSTTKIEQLDRQLADLRRTSDEHIAAVEREVDQLVAILLERGMRRADIEREIQQRCA